MVAGQYLGAGQKRQCKRDRKATRLVPALSSIVIIGLVYLMSRISSGTCVWCYYAGVHWNANRYLMIVGLSIPALCL